MPSDPGFCGSLPGKPGKTRAWVVTPLHGGGSRQERTAGMKVA